MTSPAEPSVSDLRAAAEAANRRAEQLGSALLETRRILDHSQDALMVLDDERRYVSINRAASRMFERAPHEILGRTFETVLGFGEDIAAVEATWAGLLAAGSLRTDWTVRLPSGAELVLDVTVTASYQPGRHLVALRDVTAARRDATELAARETRLRFLLEEIERVRDDERRRLAADIHDQSLQHLIAARMSLGVADQLGPTDGVAMYARAGELLDGAVLATRELLQRLAPLHTEHRSLEETIAAQVGELADLHGVTIAVDLDVPVTLTEERRLLVSRILGEAVVNACRHSGSSRIRVDGRVEHGTVRLHVGDDGCGFDPEALEAGVVGLQLMQERMVALGGELRLRSELGGGTDVTMTVPLR
ncbi:MAG: domain S-box protein [Thermoleophilia bacterium]|nr:domain S-box protein [Thermoleophilia bacterium]